MERKKTMKMNLLMAFEQIIEKAKYSQLSDEFYSDADKCIKYVSTKLGLTKEQSVMMALFLNKSDDSNIYISEIGDYVKCSTIRIMRYKNDIDVLENREYIRCCREKGRIRYRVPIDVVELSVTMKCTFQRIVQDSHVRTFLANWRIILICVPIMKSPTRS